MILTEEEFSRIRPLKWIVRDIGTDRIINTTATSTDTQLFWLDFMRLVFAPKYKSQNSYTDINQFNINSSVFLSDDLELTLPQDLELAMYYANNKTLPFYFKIVPWKQLTILIIAVLLICLLMVFNFIYGKPINETKMLII